MNKRVSQSLRVDRTLVPHQSRLVFLDSPLRSHRGEGKARIRIEAAPQRPKENSARRGLWRSSQKNVRNITQERRADSPLTRRNSGQRDRRKSSQSAKAKQRLQCNKAVETDSPQAEAQQPHRSPAKDSAGAFITCLKNIPRQENRA